MKEKQDYIQDITEVRNMMERSSKFLSLSGLAGVAAGIYALLGAYAASLYLNVHTTKTTDLIFLAISVLILALGTAIFLSHKKAIKKQVKFWDPTARRIVVQLAVPLITGGIVILILIAKGLVDLAPPMTLIFYGLALYNAGKFTYQEIKSLGIIEIVLGLISAYFVQYGLLFWAIGFGLLHIIYGIYMHYRYDR